MRYRTTPPTTPAFTSWADDYFYLPHRHETRGVGGIFFDRLHGGPGRHGRRIIRLRARRGRGVRPLLHRADAPKTTPCPSAEREADWQTLRRNRYAEFNLAFDRGTRFGLETGGRTESILMSLPPAAGWSLQPRPARRRLAGGHYPGLAAQRRGVDGLVSRCTIGCPCERSAVIFPGRSLH
ncbi:MAG: coproporphyrinogen III oxidase [Hymenobacter sp.]